MTPTEEQLIILTGQIGAIAEMNGPSTASFADYLKRRLDGRSVGTLTLTELLYFKAHWTEQRERILGS